MGGKGVVDGEIQILNHIIETGPISQIFVPLGIVNSLLEMMPYTFHSKGFFDDSPASETPSIKVCSLVICLFFFCLPRVKTHISIIEDRLPIQPIRVCTMLEQGSHKMRSLGFIKIAPRAFGLPRGPAKGRLFSLVGIEHRRLSTFLFTSPVFGDSRENWV